MRRRALCAASMPSGGGDVGGGFTAYFYFDYCEDVFFMKFCERAPDALGVACYNEVVRLIDLYGVPVTDNETIIIVEDPQQYGFNVTLEGEEVVGIEKDYGAYFFITNGEYSYSRVEFDGTILYEM